MCTRLLKNGAMKRLTFLCQAFTCEHDNVACSEPVLAPGVAGAVSELIKCWCGGEHIYVMRCAVMYSHLRSLSAAHMLCEHVRETKSHLYWQGSGFVQRGMGKVMRVTVAWCKRGKWGMTRPENGALDKCGIHSAFQSRLDFFSLLLNNVRWVGLSLLWGVIIARFGSLKPLTHTDFQAHRWTVFSSLHANVEHLTNQTKHSSNEKRSSNNKWTISLLRSLLMSYSRS